MKRSVFMILACLLSSFAFLPLAYSLPWPPEMDVVYIKFDYTSGNSDDALDIKRNNSTDIQKPEWYPAYNRNEPMAYIKENECFIQARFWVDRTGFDYAGIYADMSGSGIGDVPEQAVNFNDTQYATETMECFGSVPGSVGIRSFSWDWYVTYIDAVEFEEPLWIGTSGDHEYYTVLAAPQAPMSVPWTEVLDYACDWASGRSDLGAALQDLTESLYNCGVEYDGGTHYTSGSYTNLNLTSLIDDLSNPSSVEMDCRDFSNFLQVLLNALGGNCQYNRIDRTSSPNYLYYNYLWPAGWGGYAFNGVWDYHQVGWYGSDVADASTKIDNDINPRSSPFTWKLVVGDMDLTDYIEKLTSDDDVTSVFTGTCTIY